MEKEKSCKNITGLKVLPARRDEVEKKSIWLKYFDDFYGYRGSDARVFHLNAWEFLKFWKIEELRAPPHDDDDLEEEPLTKWVTCKYGASKVTLLGKDRIADKSIKPIPGKHYVINDWVYGDRNYIVYPEVQSLPEFRYTWIMKRRVRPMVPAPTGMPMPDRQSTAEGCCKLFSVYMRPWVLDQRFASRHVPHIRDLDVTPLTVNATPQTRRRLTSKRPEPGSNPRSYQHAWRWYIRGHVVSQHARRLQTKITDIVRKRSKIRENMRKNWSQGERAPKSSPGAPKSIPGAQKLSL